MSISSASLVMLAGLLGLSGVALGAAAAHGGFGENLKTASVFLLMHAGPVLAVGISGRNGWLWVGSAGLMAAGAILFGGQLAAGALFGASLFPLAAPTGGWAMMLGWSGLIGAAIAQVFGRANRDVTDDLNSGTKKRQK
jgi:uncharacterized membrane protein YgdD (TMEM256/DUF423 family)